MRRGWFTSAVLFLVLWAAPLRAQVSSVDTQVQINAAVQDALAWTALYDLLADGSIGEKSIAAIAEFQRRQGWAPTGDLDHSPKLWLLQIADAARRQVGFQVVDDSRAAMAIALPTRLLAGRTDTPHGSRYASADGQIEVYLARFRPEERTLSSLYDTVIGSSSMTEISYKARRRDAFFVAGFNAKSDFYHSARVIGGEVRGFTIAYPRERASEFGPIIVAMGNSFKAPMVDYAQIANMIPQVRSPAVAGFEQRSNRATSQDASCEDLWVLRNSIFKASGYCFPTEGAVNHFGNEGCRFTDVNDVPLSERQRDQLATIRKAEVERSCGQIASPPILVQSFRVVADVSDGILNLRTGPSTSFPVVAKIPAGAVGIRQLEPCTVPAGRPGWCKIEWSGFRGWASMSGLAESPPIQHSAPSSRHSSVLQPSTSSQSGTSLEPRRNPTGQISAPMPAAVSHRVLLPADLFERVKDTVWVVIAAESIESLRDDAALGSAVAISSSELVTNCHVVANKPIIGLVQGKTVLRAKLTSARPAQDRCVLITDGKLSSVSAVRPFSDLRVGERVYTIGTPRLLERTLGEGLISGLRPEKDRNWVQTSAPISQGSSGGGLFDERGNLIGVTTYFVKESQALCPSSNALRLIAV